MGLVEKSKQKKPLSTKSTAALLKKMTNALEHASPPSRWIANNLDNNGYGVLHSILTHGLMLFSADFLSIARVLDKVKKEVLPPPSIR